MKRGKYWELVPALCANDWSSGPHTNQAATGRGSSGGRPGSRGGGGGQSQKGRLAKGPTHHHGEGPPPTTCPAPDWGSTCKEVGGGAGSRPPTRRKGPWEDKSPGGGLSARLSRRGGDTPCFRPSGQLRFPISHSVWARLRGTSKARPGQVPDAGLRAGALGPRE